MLGRVILLPFRVIGLVLKVLFKIMKFLTSNVLGTLIVATIGFMLGMKYLEYEQRKRENR